jgi:hypothetical protein
MNVYSCGRNLTVRTGAVLTIVSLLMAAFPASFSGFNLAGAATDVFGPNTATVSTSTPYSSGSVDATGFENLSFSFEYDHEELDSGDSFTYDVKVGGVSQGSSTIPGVNADSPGFQSVSVDLSAFPEATDIELEVTVSANTATDVVELQGIVLTGDAVATPVPVVPYENDFESDTDGWNDFSGGTITQVTTNTDGVVSQCGDGHAVVDGPVFTRWGGYANTFPTGGYTTEVDVYLDMTESDGSPDKGFDFSSAINTTDENVHRRDFIIHLETDSTQSGVWLVDASNNAPGNPSGSSDAVEITTTGWYTLQAYFYDSGVGVLAVDLNVIERSSNTTIFSETRSDPSDVIGSTVGGNRYGWFTSQRFDLDEVAIDNAQLYLGAPQTRTCADDNKTEVEIDIRGNTSTFYDEPGTWLFNRDTNTATEFEFNEDHATLGNGALYVFPIDGNLNGKNDKFVGELFLHELVSNIDRISYNYRLGSGASSGDANEFYANAYINFDDSDDFGHCVYNIVPTDGSPGWHTMTFNPFLDYDVRQRGSSPSTCPDSPADMGPDAELRMFALNLGDTGETAPGSNIGTDQGVDGYFDEVVVETDTMITTYDLEPDDIRPVFSYISPADGYVTNGDFTVEVEATDNLALDTVVVNIKDAGGGHIGSCLNADAGGAPIYTGSCTVDVGSLAEGEYQLRGNARDVAGNLSTTLSQTFFVDRTGPVIVVDSPADNAAFGGDFDITVTATDDIELGSVVINIKDEFGGHIGTCLNETVSGVDTYTTSCTVDTSGLGEGTFQFRTNARDAAGNISNTINQTFLIDSTRPVIVVDSPVDNLVTNDDFDITVTATDDTGIVQVVINIKDEFGGHIGTCLNETVPGLTPHTTSCTIDASDLGEGIYQFRTNARDQSGNLSNTINQTFTIAEAELTILTPTPNEMVAGTYDFTAEYDDDDMTEDTIQWAVRAGTCNAGVNTVAGNVDGFSDSSSFVSDLFSTSLDTTSWANGNYCFIVNPKEQSGETDLRATQLFTVKNYLTCEMTSDSGTVVVENNSYATSTYEHRNWTASIPGATWVWETFLVEDPSEVTVRTFKETFSVDGVGPASLEVAADNGYKVYMNGNLVVDRSTLPNNFQTHTQNTYDVGGEIVEGENTLLIEVTNFATSNNPRNNPAGVLYRLVVSAENECSVTTAVVPETFTVTGSKFNSASSTDNGIADWTIYASSTNELLSTTTDSTGAYSFVLATGTWTISEELPTGWEQVSVSQNGTTTSGTTCVFTNVSEDQTCDFYNQATTTTSVSNGSTSSSNNDGNGGSSTGTLVGARDFSFSSSAPAGQVLGAATTNECPFVVDYMQVGWENDPFEVMKLQWFLHIFRDLFGGTENVNNGVASGVFDATTDANVKAFQAYFRSEVLDPWFEQGIVPHNRPTGFVYKTTIWKINDIVCPGAVPEPDLSGEDLSTNVDID